MPEGVLDRAFGADSESDGCPLSGRELEVLRLAARRMPNRRIASSLHLSEATVKRHLANAYPKMGVCCRGEAVVRALSEGWSSASEILAALPRRPADTDSMSAGRLGRAGR